MVSLTTFMVCFLSFGVGFVKPDSESDGYSGDVKALFEDLPYNYWSNIATARSKMNEFSGNTWDRKYAIAIINLYTQESEFYTTLNFEMRNNYPSSGNMWKRSGNLINKGLDILGLEVHKLVYRGCEKLDELPVKGQDYRFNQITSTSLSKVTALNFMQCADGYLFQIGEVYGVDVGQYSKFGPNEQEVIIKSNNVFKVTDGPIKESYYNVYYLDGQPNVNGVGERSAEIITQCIVALVLILYFR